MKVLRLPFDVCVAQRVQHSYRFHPTDRDDILEPSLQMAVEFLQHPAITRSCSLDQIIVSRPRNFDEPLRLRCCLEQAVTEFQWYDLVAVTVEKQQRLRECWRSYFSSRSPGKVGGQ